MSMNWRQNFSIAFLFVLFQLSLNGQQAFYQDFRLGNGLKVLVIADSSSSIVNAQLYADYPIEKEGHLAGIGAFAMALKVKMAATQYPELAAATYTDGHSLCVKTGSEHLEQLLIFIHAVVNNSDFDAKLLEDQKKDWLQNLQQNNTKAQWIAERVGKVRRFAGHPYAEISTIQTISNITVADCSAFWQRYIHANLSYLALSGKVDLATAKTLAEQQLEKWVPKPLYKNRMPGVEYPLESTTYLVLSSKTKDFAWELSYPFYLRRAHDETLPAMVAVELLKITLGEKLKSRNVSNAPLQVEILPDRHFGQFRVSYASPKIDEVLKVAEWTRETLTQLPQLINDPALVQQAKGRLMDAYQVAMKDQEILTTFALNTLRYKLDKDYYPDIVERIAKVDIAALQQASSKLLHADPVHMVLVGEESVLSQKEVRDQLFGKIQYADERGIVQQSVNTFSLDKMKASDIFQRYMSAIGGQSKVEEIRDLLWFSEAKLGEDLFQTVVKKKVGGKMNMSVKKNGSLQTQIKFDGKKGGIWNNGTAVRLEGEMLHNISLQSPVFPEMAFLDSTYQKEKIGETEINGLSVFQIRVTSPDGAKVDLYYDLNTGLKIAQSQPNGPGGTTSYTYFDDYRSVNGILFPWQMTTVVGETKGLTFQTTHILFNQRLVDSEFSIK